MKQRHKSIPDTAACRASSSSGQVRPGELLHFKNKDMDLSKLNKFINLHNELTPPKSHKEGRHLESPHTHSPHKFYSPTKSSPKKLRINPYIPPPNCDFKSALQEMKERKTKSASQEEERMQENFASCQSKKGDKCSKDKGARAKLSKKYINDRAGICDNTERKEPMCVHSHSKSLSLKKKGSECHNIGSLPQNSSQLHECLCKIDNSISPIQTNKDGKHTKEHTNKHKTHIKSTKNVKLKGDQSKTQTAISSATSSSAWPSESSDSDYDDIIEDDTTSNSNSPKLLSTFVNRVPKPVDRNSSEIATKKTIIPHIEDISSPFDRNDRKRIAHVPGRDARYRSRISDHKRQRHFSNQEMEEIYRSSLTQSPPCSPSHNSRHRGSAQPYLSKYTTCNNYIFMSRHEYGRDI